MASEGRTPLHPDFITAIVAGNNELPQTHMAQTILAGHAAIQLVTAGGESFDHLVRGYPSDQQLDFLAERALQAHTPHGIKLTYRPEWEEHVKEGYFSRSQLAAVVGEPILRVICAATNYAEAMLPSPTPDKRYYIPAPKLKYAERPLRMHRQQKAYCDQLFVNPESAPEKQAFQLMWQTSKDTLRSPAGRGLSEDVRRGVVAWRSVSYEKTGLLMRKLGLFEGMILHNFRQRADEFRDILGCPLPRRVIEEFVSNIARYSSDLHGFEDEL